MHPLFPGHSPIGSLGVGALAMWHGLRMGQAALARYSRGGGGGVLTGTHRRCGLCTHRYRTLVQTAFSLMRMLMGDYEFDRFWEVSARA